MKRIIKLFFIFSFVFFLQASNLYADNSHFIDFSKVLNESIAGKKAQDFLKKKFKSESEKYTKIQENLKKEEREIISKKKLIKKEEYQKKVEGLRKKVSDLQKNRQKSLNEIAKMRNKARGELLKTLNPILKKYMEDNNIRLVLDKKTVLLGDNKLDITDQIIKLLNKELKSLSIK